MRNPRSAVPRKGPGQYQTTYLEQGVTVGANATIVCGTRLGRYAFVGAGSVVTHNVPAYALVFGTPARSQGWMSAYGHRLVFDKSGRATCPRAARPTSSAPTSKRFSPWPAQPISCRKSAANFLESDN